MNKDVKTKVGNIRKCKTKIVGDRVGSGKHFTARQRGRSRSRDSENLRRSSIRGGESIERVESSGKSRRIEREFSNDSSGDDLDTDNSDHSFEIIRNVSPIVNSNVQSNVQTIFYQNDDNMEEGISKNNSQEQTSIQELFVGSLFSKAPRRRIIHDVMPIRTDRRHRDIIQKVSRTNYKGSIFRLRSPRPLANWPRLLVEQ